MAQEQVHKQKQQTRTEETQVSETTVDATNAELAQTTEETLDKIDDVLDEQLLADLDDLMGTEEEAEQMVAEYIQMGGE